MKMEISQSETEAIEKSASFHNPGADSLHGANGAEADTAERCPGECAVGYRYYKPRLAPTVVAAEVTPSSAKPASSNIRRASSVAAKVSEDFAPSVCS